MDSGLCAVKYRQMIRPAQFDIGFDNNFYRTTNILFRDRGPQDFAKRGMVASRTTQCNLVPVCTVLGYTE
jgi:hypothetical protein